MKLSLTEQTFLVYYRENEVASLLEPNCLGVIKAFTIEEALPAARRSLALRFPDAAIHLVPMLALAEAA